MTGLVVGRSVLAVAGRVDGVVAAAAKSLSHKCRAIPCPTL
jgi:hypothetical protein